ncbi:PadR family transcriptional regulator [Paenibacillus sp. S-38]|uniref:PadR family transcriptional regulator n=1 Tax=Paenibacillus sp. S-38 TaxID=3416710 RepID=UPI003CF6812B
MRNEMIKGYIDAIILSILQNGDAYGYEITKIVNASTEGAFELKEGTMYPALKRLEANGFIEGYWDKRDAGPRRRYYRITEEGQGKLARNKESWVRNTQIINQFLGGLGHGQGGPLSEPNT